MVMSEKYEYLQWNFKRHDISVGAQIYVTPIFDCVCVFPQASYNCIMYTYTVEQFIYIHRAVDSLLYACVVLYII